MTNHIRILGTRGIPASHGGFETFAEHLALYLAEHNWEVTVYCQDDGGEKIYENEWHGVKLIHIPVKRKGALGTIEFDWKSTLHAAGSPKPILTLGYNTAIFCLIYRLMGIYNFINMDGIEWKRDKWSQAGRIWLYLNEWFGCLLGNHLVADHPEIENHLATRVNRNKITMISYGADPIYSADPSVLREYDLEPHKYMIVIARPEPENSILEIVKAFSTTKRNINLVVLGNFDKADPAYRNEVFNSASSEVVFPGAIYDKPVIQSLRYFAIAYIHGHQVGGTNPSLVEALGASNAIIAHDNKFNRWVTQNKQLYFSDIQTLDKAITLLTDNPPAVKRLSEESARTFHGSFTWDNILQQYMKLLVTHD